ncbi:MAG: hypothetical protein ACI4ES_16485 [Roseburia sp.]
MKKLATRISALVFAMMLLFANCVTVFAEDVTPDDGRWEAIEGDGYYIWAATKTDAGWLAGISVTETVKSTDRLTSIGTTAIADPHVIDYSYLVAELDGTTDAKASTALLSALAAKKMSFGLYKFTDNKSEGITFSKVTKASSEFAPSISVNTSNAAATAKLAGVSAKTMQFTINGTGALPGTVEYIYYSEKLAASEEAFGTGYCYYYNPARDLFEYVGQGSQRVYNWSNSYKVLNVDMVTQNKGTYILSSELLPDSITTGKVTKVDTTTCATTAQLTSTVSTAISAAEAGTVLSVEVPKGTVFAKSLWEEAKAKGVGIALTSTAGTYVNWAFAAITNPVDFDPTVNVGTEIKDIATKMSSVTLPSTLVYTTVDFAFDGNLPGQAEVTLDLSGVGKFADGATVILYYYNPDKKIFEKVDSASYKEGYATFTMTHCSDYIVSSEELPTSLTSTAVKTNDMTNVIPYIVLLTFGAVAIGSAVVVKRRKF